MTFSLIAVFIPVLFMGGIVGRLFREFALTISLAIFFSGMVALTLTPMLCNMLLRTQEVHKPGRFSRGLEKGFDWILGRYERSLATILRFRFLTLLATFALLGASIVAFIMIPKGFFPQEDTGFISVSTEGAQDISYEAMLEKQKEIAKIVQDHPDVVTVFSATGGGRGSLNSGRMFVSLKDSNRASVFDIVQTLRKQVSAIPGIKVYFQPIQNIQIGGRAAKSQYQYTLQGNQLDQLYDWSDKLKERLAADPLFQDVTSDLQLNSPQAVVTVDQQAASRAGITYDDVRQALYSAYGSSQTASIYTASNDYQVIFEVEPRFQKSVEDMNLIYVASSDGKTVVPLPAIATISRSVAALSINHQGQLPAITISFNLSAGKSLGEAITRINEVQKDMNMPANITGNFQGAAQAFQDSLAGQGALLIFAVLVIYIILGMLYESFIHPITILSGLPSAGLGAILTLMLFKMELSVISIIGIVLLIGIVKKNSIMMVDFAISARSEGKSAEDAIYQACVLRFRPIMMTTMAAIFGTLPIALGIGAGAELRQPLGVAVVGGLITSQLLTLYITPVVYLYMDRASNYLKQRFA